MREINLIVIHCSATREDRTLSEHDLEVCHRRRGFNGTGYHFYIRKDGTAIASRPVWKIGAHAKGWNLKSVGVCYEGGLDCRGRAKDTRTPQQKDALEQLVARLLEEYPGSRVCGHRDLSPDLNGNGEIEPEEWIKQCPCYEVESRGEFTVDSGRLTTDG